MRDLVILFVHIIATLGPGGIRSVVLQIALLPVCVFSSFALPV
jgi:hypothetical protein